MSQPVIRSAVYFSITFRVKSEIDLKATRGRGGGSQQHNNNSTTTSTLGRVLNGSYGYFVLQFILTKGMVFQ